MDIQNLHAFIKVSETASFSKAAEQLHLTQPAVSKRIAALEQELGTALFERSGKEIRLTVAGKALLSSARKILEALEESRRIINNLSGKVAGQLRLGTSHHVGLHHLPPVLRTYTSRYPDVELDIHFMDSEVACLAVEKGDLELAVVTLPEQAQIQSLRTRLIWQDPLKIVTAKNHPLTKVGSRISVEDLIRYPAILPSPSTFTRMLIERHLHLNQHRLKIKLETNYLETIKMMVSIGLGWSVLPQTMLNKELIPLEMEGIDISRNLGAVFHADRTLSIAAQKMLETLEK